LSKTVRALRCKPWPSAVPGVTWLGIGIGIGIGIGMINVCRRAVAVAPLAQSANFDAVFVALLRRSTAAPLHRCTAAVEQKYKTSLGCNPYSTGQSVRLVNMSINTIICLLAR
jgi:hypothetical protein